MAYEGQLFRGLKWYQFRDKDGNYKKGILESEKEIDLNLYINFIKGKDETRINEILQKLSFMARSGQKKFPEYQKFLEELKNVGPAKIEVKSEKKK